MKNAVILLTCLFTSMLYAQTKNNIFKDNKPERANAIFVADMPPCIIGVTLKYGKDIGVSDDTVEKAGKIVAIAKAKVPYFKKELRALDIELTEASLNEDYEQYNKILREIADLKIKASLFHEELVKQAHKEFAKEDVAKLVNFIRENQDEFLKAAGL